MTPFIGRPRSFFVLGLLLAVTAGALYQPGLDSFFDPQDFISVLLPGAEGSTLQQRMVRDWSSWETDNLFFRPFLTLLFSAEYHLWRDAPAGYRIVNVALLVATGLLVAGLVRRLTGSGPAAWAAGLLFVTHPETVYAMMWITSRGDILATLFSLAAMLMTIRAASGEWTGAAGALPAAAALLAAGSKEIGIGCLLFLPILYFLWPDRRRDARTTLWFILPLLAAAAVTLSVRWLLFDSLGGYPNTVITPGTLLANALVLLRQMLSIFFPPIPAVAFGVVLLSCAICAWRNPRRLRLLLIGALVFGISSAQSLVAEPFARYAYMSSAVFLVIFVSCVSGIGVFRRRGAWCVPALLFATMIVHGFLLAGTNIARLRDWHDLRRPVFYEYAARIEEISQGGPYYFVQQQQSGPGFEAIKLGHVFVRYLLALEGLAFDVRVVRDIDSVPPGYLMVTYDTDVGKIVIQRHKD